MTGRFAPLVDAFEEQRFGGKASGLCAALRAGLPVPAGVALAVELVDRLAAGDDDARALCLEAFEATGGGRVAARSSAVGEDAAGASFAGQHLTRLNVTTGDALVLAVSEIHASGQADSAMAYRARMGISAPPRVAVVVQQMVFPDCAGVLFTKNPVTGADERIVEATWGLGEAVVGGLCDPDRWRIRRGGEIVEEVVGEKDVALLPRDDGGTEERPIEPARRNVPCLDPDRLARLDALATRCETHFPGAHDVEWAFVGDTLYLLQRRPATR